MIKNWKGKKIGIKYCGGCNPDYDRTAAAAKIGRMLADKAEIVSLEDESVDIVLAIQGCPTACADLRSFKGRKVVILASEDDIQDFIAGDD